MRRKVWRISVRWNIYQSILVLFVYACFIIRYIFFWNHFFFHCHIFGTVCHQWPLSAWTHTTHSRWFNFSFNHSNLALYPSKPLWQTVMKYETSVTAAAKIKPWLKLIDQSSCGLDRGNMLFSHRACQAGRAQGQSRWRIRIGIQVLGH